MTEEVIYNKLVRDRTAEIIKSEGRIAYTHIANNVEYSEKLREKLKEEVDEYLKDGNKDELVDILEVVYALGNVMKINKEELETARQTKAVKRGIFLDRIILEKVNRRMDHA